MHRSGCIRRTDTLMQFGDIELEVGITYVPEMNWLICLAQTVFRAVFRHAAAWRRVWHHNSYQVQIKVIIN